MGPPQRTQRTRWPITGTHHGAAHGHQPRARICKYDCDGLDQSRRRHRRRTTATLVDDRDNAAACHGHADRFHRRARDPSSVIEAVPADMRMVVLDPTKDGVDQIAQTLAGQQNIAAIHIIANGSSTDLRLGNADLTAVNMATTYAADMATIKAALAPNADVFVYGNAFGSGTDGAAAASQLSALTGAYVAPATDRTGTIAALARTMHSSPTAPQPPPTRCSIRCCSRHRRTQRRRRRCYAGGIRRIELTTSPTF